MPKNMSLDDGALIEPLAVAVHSVERTCVKTGSAVIVFGAGPVGLLTAAVALAEGAICCTLFDIDQTRLDFAKTYLGPKVNTTLLPKMKFQNADETISWVQEKAISLGYSSDSGEPPFADVVYECTGSVECIMFSLYVVKRGCTVMLIGLGQDKVLLPTDIITTREVDVRGNFRYANVHQKSIALVQHGHIQLPPLVSHRFKLENTIDAFQFAETGGGGIIKIIITDYQ
jgi:threonine dehydrogenase-like Zn-dependent dehydrogenase